MKPVFKKRWIFVILVVACLGLKAQASLMLSPSELKALDQALKEKDDTIQDDTMTLNAIMFFCPNRWTFWLNEKAITPNTIPRHILVHSVTENQVCFSLNGLSEKITLNVYENYTVQKE